MALRLLPSEVVKGTLMCLPVLQVKMFGGASNVARGFAMHLGDVSELGGMADSQTRWDDWNDAPPTQQIPSDNFVCG